MNALHPSKTLNKKTHIISPNEKRLINYETLQIRQAQDLKNNKVKVII